MDCIVHRVTKSRTRLSNFHFHFKGRYALSLSVWMLLKSPTGHSYPAPLPSCGSHPRHLLSWPSFDPWVSPESQQSYTPSSLLCVFLFFVFFCLFVCLFFRDSSPPLGLGSNGWNLYIYSVPSRDLNIYPIHLMITTTVWCWHESHC